MKSLVWFRTDLRIDDNPALREACKLSDEVHAVYIYSEKQNKEHSEANCKIEFIINKNIWESLPLNLQEIIKNACYSNYIEGLSESFSNNSCLISF